MIWNKYVRTKRDMPTRKYLSICNHKIDNPYTDLRCGGTVSKIISSSSPTVFCDEHLSLYFMIEPTWLHETCGEVRDYILHLLGKRTRNRKDTETKAVQTDFYKHPPEIGSWR